MSDHYGPWFDSLHCQSYEHWEAGDPVIDFDVELVKLRERSQPLLGGEEVVLAKSAGSLLALVAIAEGILRPTHCVFFGMPLDMAAEDLFQNDWSALETLTVPTLVFHNSADPTADYRFTAAALQQYAPTATLITTEEKDHWYGDVETYDSYIKDFLRES